MRYDRYELKFLGWLFASSPSLRIHALESMVTRDNAATWHALLTSIRPLLRVDRVASTNIASFVSKTVGSFESIAVA